MITQQLDSYIKECMNTWLLCEAGIHTEKGKPFPKERLLQAYRNCAQSCLSVASQFISNPLYMNREVSACVHYCRECYKECMLYDEEEIEYCGEVCVNCARKIETLMAVQLN